MHSIRPRAAAAAGLLALVAWAGPSAAQDVTNGSETVRRAIHVCASCHGEGGVSHTGGVPSLAGQPAQYSIAQMKDFREQQRAEVGTKAYMWGVSALLDDATITGLANYYAEQTPPPGGTANRRLSAAGQRIFSAGMPARGVRACASCHGDKAEGTAGFPRLAGQRKEYLLAQMKLFSTKLRPHGVLMKEELRGMTAADARAVAEYLHGLN